MAFELLLSECARVAGALRHGGGGDVENAAQDRLPLLDGNRVRDLFEETCGFSGRARGAREIEDPVHARFGTAGYGKSAVQQGCELISAVHADVVVKKLIGLSAHSEDFVLADGGEGVLGVVPEFRRDAAGVLLAAEGFERELIL